MSNSEINKSKLYKYMSSLHDINYVDPKMKTSQRNNSKHEQNKFHSSRETDKFNPSREEEKFNLSREENKFINVTDYPADLVYTYQSWYEDGTSDFIYYPYNYKFGVPNSNYQDNYGGFMN
jgi:hypothetical protein